MENVLGKLCMDRDGEGNSKSRQRNNDGQMFTNVGRESCKQIGWKLWWWRIYRAAPAAAIVRSGMCELARLMLTDTQMMWEGDEKDCVWRADYWWFQGSLRTTRWRSKCIF
jgi:hypothetical protein